MNRISLDFDYSEEIGHQHLQNIPVLEPPTFESFFKNFMSSNLPCIIQNVTENWGSSYWMKDDQLNINYLNHKYGDNKVMVYNCNKKYFNSHETSECKFSEYLDYWTNHESNQSDKDDLLYLKDWHLKNQYPDEEFYNVPVYFASDWLNEYLIDNRKDDYRFVYMGVKGTWTPFHADVFMSYSWSANVCGKKKWILFPPGEEKNLKDSLGNFLFSISDALSDDIKYYEVIQNTGEAIFVPSGWYHQVWNLEDTISINHNWVNGCNIDRFWKALSDNLDLVKQQIEDCRDMDDFSAHCQLMLNASHGMNFGTFYDFLEYIASRRISMIKSGACDVMYNGYIIDHCYAVYDVKCIKLVLEKLLKHEDFCEATLLNHHNPQKLLENMNSVLESVV